MSVRTTNPPKKPSLTILGIGFVMLLGFSFINMDPSHYTASAVSSSVDNRYTGTFSSSTQPNPLSPFGSLFTGLAVGAVVRTMTIDVGANCAGDTLKAALYNSAGNLLSATNSVLCTVGKINVILNSPVIVPANGKLWAMVMSSGGHAQFNAKDTGTNTSYVGANQGSLTFPSIIPSLVANHFYSPHVILFLQITLAPPQPPTGLTATVVSSSQINLSWNAPTNTGGSPILGYKIERSTNGGQTWSTIVANTGSTATRLSDIGLAFNTAYTYRVSAINAIGTSSPSNTASVVSSSVDNRYTGTFSSSTQPNPLSPFGSLFTGLAAGTVFRTMTIDVGANCAGDTLKAALYNSAGNLLSATNSALCTVGKMSLTLNNPVTVPKDGKLWAMVMSSGGHAQFNAKDTGTNTSYVGANQGSLTFPSIIPSLVANHFYSPHVILFLQKNLVLTTPQPPTGLTATAVSSSKINLSWNAPTNTGGSPILGYKIERSTNGGQTWSVIVSNTGSTATTYSNIGLNSNTAYTYRVSAINAIGTGSPSNTATTTTNNNTSSTTRISMFLPDRHNVLMPVLNNHLDGTDAAISFRIAVLNKFPVENRILLAQSFVVLNQAITTANSNPVPVKYIAYDNEAKNSDLSTPSSELINLADSTNRAADLVHQAGYKFAATPGIAVLLKEYQGVQWNKVDVLVMQLQKITNQPSKFQSTAETVSSYVKGKNPNTQIFVQVNPTFDTISNIVNDIKSIRNSIDGVSIVCSTHQGCTATMLDHLLSALGR